MPEELLESLKSKLKRSWEIAFISTLVIGFITHMYVFTNMLPNHDGLINIYNTQLKFKSGRFFLGPFSGISSFFDLPWVIGTLSLVYLGIMTVIITELFELEKTISIVLTAGFVVTFPTVAATFSYMFTADGYMAGNLLAVLSILLTKKYRFGYLLGAIIFYISVGIYQANLTVVLTFVAVWLIRELLFQSVTIKGFFIYMAKFVAMTGIGMALYTVTFKVYQHFFKGEVTDYQGIDQIGERSGSLVELLMKIKNATYDFFFKGLVTDSPTNLFEILNLLLLLIIIFMTVAVIVTTKLYRKPPTLLIITLSFISIPVLSFILYFVSPGVSYHMLMVMSLVSVYLIPVFIYDKLNGTAKLNIVSSWGMVFLSFLIIFNFMLISNISYFNMTLKYEKSYATVNRILDRVEQTEGYEEATKLAVLGRITMKTEVGSEKIPENLPVMTGAMGEYILAQPYHYEYMLANYFGKSLVRVDEEQLEQIRNSKDFEKMEPWPSRDSVKIVGDTVIIKLSQ